MKKAVSLFVVLCMICSTLISVHADDTSLQTVYAPNFYGLETGTLPEGWTGVNFSVGLNNGYEISNYGQLANYKVGQNWGSNGYAVYNYYLWTGSYTYSVNVDGWDESKVTDTDHRSYVIFNYQDAENYYFLDMSANAENTTYLKKKVDGNDEIIAQKENSGIGRAATVKVVFDSTNNTISAYVLRKNTTEEDILFENINDTTFVGGKIGVGAQSSSFINFTNINVSGMAIDKTPEPEPEPGYALSDEAEEVVFAPTIPNSGSIPEWWSSSNVGLTNWGAFTHTAWNLSGYFTYDKYEWEQKFTYQMRISNYELNDMSSYMLFLYQDQNNYYAVEFNTTTKKVNLIKKVDGVIPDEPLATFDWGSSISNDTVTLTYDNGKISAKAKRENGSEVTFFTDVEDSDPSFTSGKIGFAYNKGGFHATGINVTGMAREWKESGTIAFPEREKVYRKIPSITSAVEVPVPEELKNRVTKTYPNGLLKAVIMDFDDGTQAWCEGVDEKIINILDKYNMVGTFNLSASNHTSGYTDAEISKYASLYSGHEIATHQIEHTEPADMSNDDLRDALKKSKQWFEQITSKWGTLPTVETEGLAIAQVGGWAYPGGGKDISEEQIAIAENLGIKYGRRSTVYSASEADYHVKIPESFFNWKATASFASTSGGKAAALAHQERYLASDLNYMTVFYSWQHGWDVFGSSANPTDISAEFDTYCKNFAKNSDTIWNPGVLEFVDYVNASKQLTVTQNEDGAIVLYNPSNAIDVWATVDYNNVMIPAGTSKIIGGEEPIVSEYEIKNASYTNQGEVLNITANIVKGDNDAEVIAAVYDVNNELIAIGVGNKISDNSDISNGEFVYSSDIVTGTKEVGSVKLFVWNSVNSLKPMCKAADCVKANNS